MVGLIYAELTLVATPSLNRDISMPLATTLVEGTDAVGTMKTLSTSAGLHAPAVNPASNHTLDSGK
ncbi:hypothetical protein H4Q26_003708 [Puccinia striiformis f. sp. tritici PST-130]|nr:hypothetical protein H4Q26_003708 [Puccinia striiformis f. sp. tritici PST-130]